MSLTNPPSSPPAAPPVPNRRTDAAPEFDSKTDAYLNWMTTFAAWLDGLVTWLGTQLHPYLQGVLTTTDGHKNAAQAAAAAAETSAQTAALIAGAQRWQPGDYAQGAVVWSPLSLLTYRRVPEGVTASTTDPSLDPSAWRLSGSPHSMPTQELTGPGPHQLVTGMHYLILSADVVAVMPGSAFAQEQLRITNLSGQSGPLLLANGQNFSGKVGDLLLDSARADRMFIFTDSQGWV